MIVLDTNVVSDLARTRRALALDDWIATEQDELVVATVSVAELDAGLAIMPRGARRDRVATDMRFIVDDVLDGHVVPFDRAAAEQYGAVVAARRAAGRPISVPDAQIAAICRARNATLATRNTRDFEHTGITVIDPSS